MLLQIFLEGLPFQDTLGHFDAAGKYWQYLWIGPCLAAENTLGLGKMEVGAVFAAAGGGFLHRCWSIHSLHKRHYYNCWRFLHCWIPQGAVALRQASDLKRAVLRLMNAFEHLHLGGYLPLNH